MKSGRWLDLGGTSPNPASSGGSQEPRPPRACLGRRWGQTRVSPSTWRLCWRKTSAPQYHPTHCACPAAFGITSTISQAAHTTVGSSKASSPWHLPGTGADDGGISQRRQCCCQCRGVPVTRQLGGRRDGLLQEGIALGALEDHVRGPQLLPQAPGTCQVPAQRRLAGDVQAGAEPSLPRSQQRDLWQGMETPVRARKSPTSPGVGGWRLPALPLSCRATICTIVVQHVKV